MLKIGHQDCNMMIHFCHILDFQKSKDIWIVCIPNTTVWNRLLATFQGSWDSIVSIVTRTWSGVWIPAGARDLSFHQNIHILRPTQSPIQWASEILCLGVKWPELSTYLCVILRLRMIGATSPLPLYALMLNNGQLCRFMDIRYVYVWKWLICDPVLQ